MAQAVQLMLAVFIAFAVFGSTLFAVSRILHTDGALRKAHIGIVAGMLLAMAAMMALSEGFSFLGLPPVPVAKLGAAVLAAATLVAMWKERGGARWSLAPLLVFGAVVLSGAPFA